MIHRHVRPALTTAQFIKLDDMGYPDGYTEWGPLEIDQRHHAYEMRKKRRRAFLFTAFVVAGALLCVWGYGR